MSSVSRTSDTSHGRQSCVAASDRGRPCRENRFFWFMRGKRQTDTTAETHPEQTQQAEVPGTLGRGPCTAGHTAHHAMRAGSRCAGRLLPSWDWHWAAAEAGVSAFPTVRYAGHEAMRPAGTARPPRLCCLCPDPSFHGRTSPDFTSARQAGGAGRESLTSWSPPLGSLDPAGTRAPPLHRMAPLAHRAPLSHRRAPCWSLPAAAEPTGPWGVCG